MLRKELEELKHITTKLENSDLLLLHQSQQWQYAFDAIPDAIFITNENFDIKFANKAFFKRFNTTTDELLSIKCHDLVHNAKHPSECVCKGQDGEPKCYGEVYSSRTHRWYLFDRAPILDNSDNLLGHINILRDVTEEKAATEAMVCAESKLKNLNERYRELVQFMGSGVAVYEAIDDGSDFIIKDFNRAAEIIEQVSISEVLNKKVTDVFPGVRDFGLLTTLREVWSNGKPLQHPISIYKDSRHTGWRSNFVYKLSTGEVVTIYDDLTEKKVTEEKIFEQERLFADIIESILAGYWDWDLKNNTEYLSPTFKQMFGYKENELDNVPETWQKLIFEEDVSLVLVTFDRHVSSKGKEPYYCEVRYHHKNGSTVWVMCVGRVIEWSTDDKPLRMIGCHVDITKLKESEADLKDNYERVKKELKFKLSALVKAPKDIKILVVDDDTSICTVITRILSQYGYQTITAETGLDALKIYDIEKPDLVIVDLKLPDIPGKQVIREINILAKGSVPLIILSGSSYIEDIANVFEECNCDYILKPISRDALLTRVRRNLLSVELFNQKKLICDFLEV